MKSAFMAAMAGTESLTLGSYLCPHLYPCRARNDISRCPHRGLYRGDLCLLAEC